MVQMECRIGSVKSYRQVNKNLKTNSSSISDKLVMRAKAMCRGDFPEEILRNNLINLKGALVTNGPPKFCAIRKIKFYHIVEKLRSSFL